MEVERDVQFLGIEEKKITKGDKAGQTFYIVKFICLNDSFEIMVFDNPELVQKIQGLTRFQDFIITLKLTQNSGNLKWNLVGVTV